MSYGIRKGVPSTKGVPCIEQYVQKAQKQTKKAETVTLDK